ncbi:MULTISPECIES: helix-turn-helix domain-containing protein [Rhodobacterales]|uniref:helix-turn-helix domain-containing protein n=1 Tax=Marivivens sp. JLT3646 TaxID=1920883 RepID=UPI0009EEC7D9
MISLGRWFRQVQAQAVYAEVRLEWARNLLLQTEMSAVEVAMACGFENSGHFTRVYRLAYGGTPMMQRGRLT